MDSPTISAVYTTLPGAQTANLTTSGRQKPNLDDGEIRMEFADIAGQIHRILAANDAGKSRVVLDPEDVVRLHGIADRLGALPAVITPNNPIG